MRLKKLVDLGDNRMITLNELRVKDARHFMAKGKELEKIDIKTLFTEQFDQVQELLGDCVVLPEKLNIDDLSFSEINQIKDGFLEVNKAFLDLAGLAGLLNPPSIDSTELAPSSSSEVTPA